MSEKHVKGSSASLAIEKMQPQGCHCTLARIKKNILIMIIVGTPNSRKNSEKLNYLYITGGDVKMVQSPRKS